MVSCVACATLNAPDAFLSDDGEPELLVLEVLLDSPPSAVERQGQPPSPPLPPQQPPAAFSVRLEKPLRMGR